MGKKKKKKSEKNKQARSYAKSPNRNLLEIICKWLIGIGIFLILLVPLMVNLNLYYPFAGFRAMWFMGIVQFIFLTWLFLAYHNTSYRPRLNLVLIALALFVFSMTLSTLFGVDPATSFWSTHSRMSGLLMHLHLFAFFLVLGSVIKSGDQWRAILSAAVVFSVLVTIWGLADNYNLDFVIRAYDFVGIVSSNVADVSQLGATLGHYSFMGSYLLVNCFLALYLVFKSEPKWRTGYGICFIILAAGIILNPGGRAMRGAFFIGLVLFALLYLAFYVRKRYVNLGARTVLAASLAASLYAGFAAFREGSLVRETIMGMFNMPGRLAKWDSAMQGILERPFLGWGPEHFDLVLYRYYEPRLMLEVDGFVGEAWHDRAHNIIFDTLLSTGIFGALFFFGMLACALFLLWRGYLKKEGVDFWAPAVFTTLLAAHFIQNLTVFDMLSSYMLIFLILAYIVFLTTRSVPGEDAPDHAHEARTHTRKKPFGVASLAILAALVAVFAFTLYNFSYKPYQAAGLVNAALLNHEKVSLAAEYREAIEASPLGAHQIRRRLSEKALGRLNGAYQWDEQAAYLDEVEYLIEETMLSCEQSPLHFRRFYTLGRLHHASAQALRAVTEPAELREKAIDHAYKAEEAFAQAVALSPKGIQAYWGLIQAKINLGFLIDDPDRFTEAYDLSMQAMELDERFITTFEFAINIADNLMQDRELALELREQALAIDPSWEGSFQRYIGE